MVLSEVMLDVLKQMQALGKENEKRIIKLEAQVVELKKQLDKEKKM